VKFLYFIPLLLFIFIPAYAYNSGFTPVYQPPGGGSANPTELYCVFGDFLNSYNATTNSFTCDTAPAGGGGENNTASNVGLGEDIFKQKTGVDLEFKGIAVSGDLSISSNTTDITLSYTDPAGGSGNSTVLDDLGDVLITSPSYLSTLFYNGVQWIDKIFSIDSKTCGAGEFVSAIDNQTGGVTCSVPAGSGNATILNDLGDVLITSPSYPSILSYDGSQWIDKVFAINTQSATNDVFITGINNQTGAITTNTFSVNIITCSGTDKVSAIDNVTGNVICSTDQTGGGGGMTTMKKTADQTINAGAAVYTDITDLSFPVTNGVDYAFHYYIVFRSSATATGFKCSVNGPAGTVDYFMTYQTVANAASGAAGVATWLQAHQIVYNAGFLNLTTITANADLVCIIDGRYKSTADGTFTARFANELANTNIVVQKGSYGWWF
jgi:hypothetical protein